MSLEEKFNLIRVTEDGIRYKKKRRHNELKRTMQIKESDLNKIQTLETNIQDKKLKADSKGKRLKQSKKDEIGLPMNLHRQRYLSNLSDETEEEKKEEKAIKIRPESKLESKIEEQIVITNTNTNTITNINNNKHTDTYINTQKNEKSDLIPTQNDIKISNNLQTDNNNNKNLFKNSISATTSSSSSNESDVKKLLNSEFERVKTKLVKMENTYNQENFNSVIKLLKNFCNKNARNANKNLKVKVANLFTDDIFDGNIDTTKYSQKSTLINLELLFFDLLVNKNKLYQSLIELESTNIGNTLLFYFSQVCMFKVLNAIIPILKGNLEKYSDVLVIKLKNVENLANENKLFAIGLFYNLLKENYSKTAKLQKMTKKGKLISNEYDNMIYSDIINIMSQSFDFKMIHCFEFESVKDVFTLNVNYIDFQLRNSNLYNKIVKHANDEAIENNQKKIKLHRMKKELTLNHTDIFQKISSFGLFYANTSDLIMDFLDN